MICVYDIGNTGYEGNGDAVLQPTACSHRNVAGGGYDLTMTHPIDREGKWKHLVPGAVIKCPVPREEIENAFAGYEADVYKANTDTALREGMSEPTAISYTQWNPNGNYQIGDKVSVPGWTHRNYKCVYFDMTSATTQVPPYNCSWWEPIADYTTGAAVLVTLPAGTELYFVQDVDGTWYKMSTYYGIIGYVKKSQLTFYRHLSQTETLPRIITEQLFRVEKPTVDTKAGTVTVNANHVSYDLSGVLIQDVNLAQASPAMALGRLAEGFMVEYAGTIATNLTAADNGTYTQNIKGKNGMYALLDPDRGIVSTFGAAFKRDNWDLFVMARTSQDRGYRIRYRKNMLGVNWAQDSSGLVTRVVPVAKDAGGADLYLPEKWVDSSRINQYPVIKMEYLTVKGQVGKDDGTGTDTVWTEEALLDEMRTKAGERFSVDKADQVGVTVTVDFEQLGAAEEHPELKGLESVLLYDTVTVIHEDIGLSLQLYVSEIEYDAVRQKVTAVKLVNAMDYNKGSVTGYNVQAKSIGSEKLMDDVAGEILEQVTGIVPQYSDQTGESGSRMNTKDNNGFVAKGSGNANKVWKTDGQGNPGWRDEQAVTGFIPTSEKGAANGVATLDSGGKVPASELPSYVDDVLEYASKSNFPATGESGKIYVAKDTGKTYRWSGSAYVELSSYAEATQSASGLMSASDKAKLDGIEAQANKYVLPQATSSALGGVKIGWTGSGKDYPVELDSNGKAHVQVPWTDNNTTYAAGTGISISGANNAIAVQTGYTQSGKNYPVQAGTGGLYVNVPWENTVYTLPLAANGTRGGVQIGYTETGKKYAVKLDSEKMYVEVPWTADGGNAATVNGKTVAANVPADAVFTDHQYSAGTGLSLSSGAFSVKLGYTTANKKYKVQADTNGNLYVDVPWENTVYTLPAATSAALGGIKTGYTASGKNYPVVLDSGNNAYVNVPWENTVYTLPLAANGTRGGIQIGYTQSGKNYPVQLSGEKAYVNVPWTADGGNADTVDNKHASDFVQKSGDTMTGQLNVTAAFTVLASDSNNEGGEITLKASKSSYPDTHIDLWQNYLRFWANGTERFKIDMTTGEISVATIPWNNVTGKPSDYPGGCTGSADKVDGYHYFRGAYVETETINQPTANAEWGAYITSQDWDNDIECIQVIAQGQNSQREYVIYTSSRGLNLWGWCSEYNSSAKVMGAYITVGTGTRLHLKLGSGTTKIKVMTSFVKTTYGTEEVTGTYFTIPDNGLFASNIKGDLDGAATRLGSSNVGSARQPIYLNAGAATAGNYTLAHLGNANSKSNMNDVGRMYPSTGMAGLQDPGNNNDNPMNGSTRSTGWHLYFDTSYQDDPNGNNSWVAQIANAAGTSQWWVRSRKGGTITDGTAWHSGWRHLVTAGRSGGGNSTTPIYVNEYGEIVSCTDYGSASVNYAETAGTATTATTASAPKFEEVTIAAGESYSKTFTANSVWYAMHSSNAGCFLITIFVKATSIWYNYQSQNTNFSFSDSGRTLTITNSSSYSAVVRIGKYYE